MIDPKVTKLVKEFEQQIEQVNKTWAKLQATGCYVRVDQLGVSTYEATKSLSINEITQHVSYKKGPQE